MSKELLRLEPVFQEKIWGGDRLRTVCTVSAEAGRDHASEAGWPGKLCGSHGKRYPEFAKSVGNSGRCRR